LFKTLANIFRIAELRNKVLFTVGLLCVYRIGFYVPLPGVNAVRLADQAKSGGDSPLNQLSNYLSVFSGGDLSRSTIFGMGIMPYISASIILQLLATVIPSLEKLRKEGEPGMRKINDWTRYLTVGVCIVQASMWMFYLAKPDNHLVYPFVQQAYLGLFVVMGIVVMTAGSLFLMWLGEQIDQYGIGNGVSLIITAGIISRMPNAMIDVIANSPLKTIWYGIKWNEFPNIALGRAIQHGFDPNVKTSYGLLTVGFLIVAFCFVVAGSILLTQAQRRIKIQQAKQMRGRKVYGGAAQYLPLRVNHAGVMPIIFASSLMVVPSMISSWFINTDFGHKNVLPHPGLLELVQAFHPGDYLYEVLYVAMIFFFSYFWNTVQFQPKEMANQLRDYGSFIPGLRPGKRTADYLENVMTRITYVGAAFLCVIAVIPSLVYSILKVDYQVAQFLGGTGLLIVISVMLDLVNRIEANLVMRNYSGFLDKSKGGETQSRLRPRGFGSSRTPTQGDREGLPQ